MTSQVRLTTLTSIRTQLQIAGTITTDDAFIDTLIDEASAWITDHTRNRSFVPYQDTRYLRQDALSNPASSRRGYIAPHLKLDEDLLAAQSITNADLDASVVNAYNLLPLNRYPKTKVELTSGSGSSWNFAAYDSDVSITGFWGYHEDYSHAWQNASSLTAVVSASGTALPVASVSDYEDGDYVLIGGSEIGRVTGTAVGTLTVLRGQNGTTPGTHAIAEAVQTYSFPADIQKTCNDLVKYYYIHRKSDTVAQIVDIGVRLETKIPSDVWDTVENYKKSDFQATGDWYEW